MYKPYIFLMIIAGALELRASQAPTEPRLLKRRTSLGEIKKRQKNVAFNSLASLTVEEQYERFMDEIENHLSDKRVPHALARIKEILAASPRPQELLNKQEKFFGCTLLMNLIYGDYHDAAVYVAQQDGLDLELQAHSKKEKSTTLIYAGKWGKAEVAQILLNKGADANYQDGYGWTAQQWAAVMQNSEVLEVFKNHGKLRMIEEESKE